MGKLGPITLANPESLAELLRAPSLRSVYFREFDFTSALSQATAKALMGGTAITCLEFYDCSFSAEGSAAVVANALIRNTSVSKIKVVSAVDQVLYSALATALPLNSTLRGLAVGRDVLSDDGPDLAPLMLALKTNTGLESLRVNNVDSIDESLSTAMKDGLGMNGRLERLVLNGVPLCDDSYALWRRAFSFLRTNTALKSLIVTLDQDVTESCFSAFCIVVPIQPC
jgi:hypothetical protein